MSQPLRRTKTVSITSGKGGVGKSTLTANLAYALAKKGHRVLIFDGDLGMANIDIMFGLKAESSIADVIAGKKELKDILVSLAPQITLIPGGSGSVELNRLNSFQRRSLLDSLTTIEYQYDYLLIDTAPGISDNVLYLNSATQVCTVIITPDPSSLTDSYALIKVMSQEFKRSHFSIVCNQVRDEAEGLLLFNKFNDVVNKFLYIGLDYLGPISQDALFRRTVQNQRLILKHEPTCLGAGQISAIASKLATSLRASEEQPGLNHYWEQVVGVA